MYPAHEIIDGMIEFDSGEARIVLQSRCVSDDTLQATLVSLAQDRMHEIADAEIVETAAINAEWQESAVQADFDALEQELLLIYCRVKSR